MVGKDLRLYKKSKGLGSHGQLSSLWPYPPAVNPKSLYLPAVHLSLRSTAQRCTQRKWRVMQVAVWISRAWKSVLPSMLYLNPRAQISCCRPKQSIVSSGMVVTKSLTSAMSLTRSVTDAFAALASTSVTKSTILWEVGASKQYLIMQGPSSLFSAKRPSKTCWMISLSVGARDYAEAGDGQAVSWAVCRGGEEEQKAAVTMSRTAVPARI